MEENSEKSKNLFAFLLLVFSVLLLAMLVTVIVTVCGNGERKTERTETATDATESQTESETETKAGETESIPTAVTYPYVTEAKRESYLPVDGTVQNLAGDIRITSENAILVDLDCLTVLASRDPDEKIYPASMTKVMTLIVACDYITDLEKKVTVTAESVEHAVSQGASRAGFDVGDVCTVKDLMYGVAVRSGAEACYLLVAETVGSETEFVKQMNRKCEELGLTHTHFSNSAGLHSEENYTTAREMAAIFAYALDQELCRELLSTESYETHLDYTKEDGTPATYRLTMYSTLFVDRIEKRGFRKQLDGGLCVMGGKTGYIDYKEGDTTVKDFTLVSYTSGNGKTYLVVTAGADTMDASVEDYQYLYNDYTGE